MIVGAIILAVVAWFSGFFIGAWAERNHLEDERRRDREAGEFLE